VSRATDEISLLRLVAQRLAGPPAKTAVEAIRWMAAIQGQDLPGAITSLALRTAPRSRDAVVAALDAGEIVRSWPMRGTLHLLAAEDLFWMLDLGARRLERPSARHAQLGLDGEILERARAETIKTLAGGGRASRAELQQAWGISGIDTTGQRGVHILGHLARTGTICLGPLRGKQQLVVLAEEWIREPRGLARDEALGEWATRYFRSHGPATAADFKRWTGLTMTETRVGVSLARPLLETMVVAGVEYLLDPSTPARLAAHRADARGVILLPGFDELVLGYADRSPTVSDAFAQPLAPGGNGLFRATVIERGRAVGTWRRAGTPAHPAIDATPFTTFSPRATARIQPLFDSLP
jgi:Winged helix DNA-binding domain